MKSVQDGYDDTIGLPLYNYQIAFKTAIEKEIVSIRLSSINITDDKTLKAAKAGAKLLF